jgi:hypothetical protein
VGLARHASRRRRRCRRLVVFTLHVLTNAFRFDLHTCGDNVLLSLQPYLDACRS